MLDAAFRQGIALMHGCKEGQCGSCKSLLIDGDVELLKYSTFALPDYEHETDHILLCRTLAYSDLTIELLNYDEDLMRRSIAVKAFPGALQGQRADVRHQAAGNRDRKAAAILGRSVCRLDDRCGAITRAFSMANAPSEGKSLRFIIKKYPNGAFSSRLDGELRVGRRADGQRALRHLLPAGGEDRPDAVDRRRIGNVTAVVDPGRSYGE